MITIKEIAKEAKVSEGTVDRVIHKRGNVSKKTEATVQRILELNNFSVNPIASALAMKKKQLIAVLIPEYNESDLFWKSPYLGIQKAEKDVESFGIKVDFFKYNQYDSSSYFETFNRLIATKPSAVVIVPNFSTETNQIVERLEKATIPYLFINIDIQGFNNLTYVGQDSFTAGSIAAKLMNLQRVENSEFLIVQARHNITKNNAVSKRIEGFENYFEKNNININIRVLKIDDLNQSTETKKIINSYLETHPKIEGIFVPSSRIHIIVNCLNEIQIAKLNLVGFDNTPQNNKCLLNDSVSFLISQKPFEQGYESIKIVTDFLIHKKEPRKKVYLPIDILMKENVEFNNTKY